MNLKTVLRNLDRIDASSISNPGLARRVARLQQKRRQGGFTLLELLVVVAILATLAGTAVIAFQDTDARASAAAHVAMMNQLDSGIRTFAAMNRKFPDRYDSLMETTTGPDASGGVAPAAGIAVYRLMADGAPDLKIRTISQFVAADDSTATPGEVLRERLSDVGITEMRWVTVSSTVGPDGGPNCADPKAVVESKENAAVAGTMFLSPAANGCGATHELTRTSSIMVWGGGTERITGEPVNPALTDFDGTNEATAAEGLPVFMAVGLGASSTLFDAGELVGFSTVPIYRHVGPEEYPRFIALFHIADTTQAGSGNMLPIALPQLASIVDGALDTKEEELGEWDNTRSTI